MREAFTIAGLVGELRIDRHELCRLLNIPEDSERLITRKQLEQASARWPGTSFAARPNDLLSYS